LVTISPWDGPHRPSPKGNRICRDSLKVVSMYVRLSYAHPRRVSFMASLLVFSSIIIGSAAALATIVPFS